MKFKQKNLFPGDIVLSAGIQTLLSEMYPTIPWKDIKLKQGLPWFMPHWVNAVVLPHIWSTRKVNVYFNDFQTHTPAGLATLVHECFHVLQYIDLGKGRGIGGLRLFLIYYFGHYFHVFYKIARKSGWKIAAEESYMQHEMEKPAYAQDNKMWQAAKQYQMQGKMLSFLKIPENARAFMAENPQLVCHTSQLNTSIPFAFTSLATMLVILLMPLYPFLQLSLQIIFYFPYVFQDKKLFL